MKNTIIIALFAVIATPAVAETKVFGQMHASIDKVFGVGADSSDGFTLKNSTFGVKGSTEIKKDISFIYQFVWGLETNGFTSQINPGFENRNQAIGLASPSGAMLVGRFDTPFKTIGKKADLFWHSQLGQNRNITNAQTWDLRADKVIVVQSPRKNGLQTSVAYASDISDTSRVTDNASAISMNGFYQKGKYVFGVGYENHNLDLLSGNKEALRLSMLYRDGPLKMVGFFQKEDNNFNETSEPDALVLGVGASYKKGKGTFKGQLYGRDIDSYNENSSLLAIGYDYRISKKTDVYAQFARIVHADNLGKTQFSESSSNLDDDVDGVSIGFRYRF